MRVDEEDPGPAGDDAHAPHTRPTPKIAATTTPPLTCRQRAGTRGCCPPPHTQAKRRLIRTPAPDRTIGGMCERCGDAAMRDVPALECSPMWASGHSLSTPRAVCYPTSTRVEFGSRLGCRGRTSVRS